MRRCAFQSNYNSCGNIHSTVTLKRGFLNKDMSLHEDNVIVMKLNSAVH